MAIASKMAGFSMQESDLLRKAIGKKDAEKMKLEREKFIGGCVKQGVNKSAATQLFDNIEEYSKYSFNLCLTGDTQVVLSNKQPITIDTLQEKLFTDKKVFLQSFNITTNISHHRDMK